MAPVMFERTSVGLDVHARSVMACGLDRETGNGHAWRLLVKAAWHHRKPGAALRRRWVAAPPAARSRGQAANQRLHARWKRFDTRYKRPVVANAAIARELAAWCWSLATLDE
jgi:transposase